MNSEHARVWKKWVESGKRARLTEHESQILAEIQTISVNRTIPKSTNEVRAFHKFITNALDY